MNRLFALALCGSAFVAVGCSSYEKRSYDVTVRNDNDRPVTVWLTKDGTPSEANWLAPEEIAAGAKADAGIAGAVVEPGKKLGTAASGRFAPDTRAILRVYDGQLKFSEILATSNKSGLLRVDVPLHPGANVVVVRKSGKLTVEAEK
ncbi:MAG: hypothetical protein QM770_23685 [Tepidisphaeraceae bacterium]